MKALIMAAGKGTRMRPLTETIPKVLIPINNKPFLYYVIENLRKAGITELGIIAGYMKNKIIKFLEENNINATIIEQTEQKGTGHAIAQAKTFCGDSNFITLGGDNLWSANDFKLFCKDDEFNYIGYIESSTPEKYGVLIFDKENNLIEIKEKPKEFIGNNINTGLYKFTPKIFSELDTIKQSDRGEYELSDAIDSLAKKGKFKVIKTQDYWLDLGCLEDIPKVSLFLKGLLNKSK